MERLSGTVPNNVGQDILQISQYGYEGGKSRNPVKQSAISLTSGLFWPFTWPNKTATTPQHIYKTTRQQNTAKQHHITEYRKDLHLLSAPVSQWGRWGGGRSSFRWLLQEDREFQRVRQRDRDKGGRGEEKMRTDRKNKDNWVRRKSITGGGERSRESGVN